MQNVFNLRAYGILINANREVLLSDEYYRGRKFSKFPGGGLEWGEGLIDCLLREFKEETSMLVKVKHHYYTTDFFQLSAFNEKEQLISVYYLVELVSGNYMESSKKKFDFEEREGAQSFRWIPLKELQKEDLTFPVDQLVAGMLKREACPER